MLSWVKCEGTAGLAVIPQLVQRPALCGAFLFLVKDHGKGDDMISRVKPECLFEPPLDAILDSLRAIHSIDVFDSQSRMAGSCRYCHGGTTV